MAQSARAFAAGRDAETFRVSPAAYDRHVGRYGSSLARHLIAVAGVQPGWHVVDVGCGPGALTEALAARVGAGNVAAAEPSESFAAAARARVPGADVRSAPAEQLPFDDGSFDAALAQLVVNFMADAERGIGEMARVTRPGGVVAACTWDYGGGMTLLRAFWDAALAVDPEGAKAADEGHRMHYCTAGELDELWRSARLDAVATGSFEARAEYRDYDDLWGPLVAGVGPSGAYCASLEPAGRSALKLELCRRLGNPEGPFGLTARAWYACGMVPARA